MSWLGRQFDKLKVAAVIKFVGPFIKTLAPYIVTGLVAIGVDPALAGDFAENATAIGIIAVTFLLDLALTALRTKKAN